MRPDKRKFTLVELLVVMVVISILAAFLLPAMQKAIANARLIDCTSRLRQTGTGIHEYAAENNGKLPVDDDPNWCFTYKAIIWFTNNIPGRVQNLGRLYYPNGYVNESLLCCPGAERQSGTCLYVRSPAILKQRLDPGMSINVRGTYSVNGQFMADRWGKPWLHVSRMNKVKNPTTMIAYDSYRYKSGQYSYPGPHPVLRMFNVLGLDGHVQSLRKPGAYVNWGVWNATTWEQTYGIKANPRTAGLP